ncbi:SAWADEE domain [Dillenia turbinata]|uniref:SAWADEE domain n=1 Tax=Dillenia turbinata TaxID=194707 RepID=A0AAN8UXJ8_9MAGN
MVTRRASSPGGREDRDDVLDFRAYEDDAWYAVRLSLLHPPQGHIILSVAYAELGAGVPDVCFSASQFTSRKDLDEFASRFRPTSVQLQDNECSKVIEGMLVSACHRFADAQLLFYDAFVDSVESKEHRFNTETGEKECSCTYVLFWQHGPLEGTLTPSGIANICLLKPSPHIHPTLTSFLDIASRHLQQHSSPSSDLDRPLIALSTGDIGGTSSSSRLKTPSVNPTYPPIWNPRNTYQPKMIEEDVDLGGKAMVRAVEENDWYHFVLVDNLERDLLPSTVIEFILKEISIKSQAWVFPCGSSDTFTRGAISSDCKKNLDRLCNFIDNPDHIIVSSRGRPWVVLENAFGFGTSKSATWTLTITQKLQKRNAGNGDKLKVVRPGSKDYLRAKQLRDLYKEFATHVERLHKSLALEEQKIFHQHNVDVSSNSSQAHEQEME